MEREHAVSHNVRVEEIITIKKNMAGPLAAIGDNFFWGTWRPFVGVMAAGIAIAFFGDHAINWPWAAPLFFVALYNLLSMGFRFWSLKISFNYREQIIRDIAGLRMQSARNAINAIGSIVAALIVIVYVLKFSHNVRDALLLAVFFSGALVCAYVKMSANLVFYGAVAVCIGVAFL
jgi:PTS system mannose-specific IID component